jgi:peptide/nickel transport system permease protein
MLSRLLYGARISLTIGLVGVGLSYLIGITVGGLAGYLGGLFDSVVQRITEVLRSIPELPLWMALSAALPVTWDPRIIYFGITIIFALLDWPSIARAVRSKLFALREEDYVTAAEMMGARPSRIIGRHMLPNFTSHLIASASLSIPSMILAETALSFLGLGLRPPITSWGRTAVGGQNIEAVALYPWLLLPMVPVMVTVLAFSFLGDGLRDAIDPHE